jgi:hypothetical protein
LQPALFYVAVEKLNVSKMSHIMRSLMEGKFMQPDIVPILDSFKVRVSKGYTLIQEEYTGDLINVEFQWNEPASKEEIESITEKTGWVLPNSYKDFLSIHNGAILFMSETHQFCLHSIEEIMQYHASRDNTFPPSWYHMGTFYGHCQRRLNFDPPSPV